MVDVLFIVPPRPGGRSCTRDKGAMGYSKAGYVFPPIDSLWIAAMLRENGATVRLYDANAANETYEKVEELIREEKPKMLVFSNSTPTIFHDLKTATLAKSVDKNIVTITFGPHVVSLGQETMAQCPDLDYCVPSEYETTILEIMKGVEKQKIEGLYYRDNGLVQFTGKREPLKDLNALPIPAHDLLDIMLYQFPYSGRRPVASTLTTRGCPYACVFCQTVLTWKKFNARSTEHILKELRFLSQELGVKEIKFWDDNFTFDQNRVVELCDAIIKEKLDLTWIVNTRVDRINEQMLLKMKEAGCQMICFGVESGDDQVLRDVKKGLTTEAIRKGFALTKKCGIRTLGFFTLGHPTDTHETIKKTIAFSKELNPDLASFNVIVPFPGTPLFETAREKGWITTYDWSKYESTSYPVYKIPNLTQDEVYNYFKQAYRGFYFRPSYIFKRLLRVRNFQGILNDTRSMIGLLKMLFEKNNDARESTPEISTTPKKDDPFLVING